MEGAVQPYGTGAHTLSRPIGRIGSDLERGEHMGKLLIFPGMILGGWIGGWIGSKIGLMTGLMPGGFGSMIGIYAGWRIHLDHFE